MSVHLTFSITHATLSEIRSFACRVIKSCISEEPCKLYCSDINDTLIVPWGEHALDGTPCRVGARDVCISGICRVGNNRARLQAYIAVAGRWWKVCCRWGLEICFDFIHAFFQQSCWPTTSSWYLMFTLIWILNYAAKMKRRDENVHPRKTSKVALLADVLISYLELYVFVIVTAMIVVTSELFTETIR